MAEGKEWIMDDISLQTHFATEKERRDSDRLVENCLKEIGDMLNDIRTIAMDSV